MIQIDDERLQLAVTAAREAGDEAVTVKETTEVSRKQDESLVTQADKQAEQDIRSLLSAESQYDIIGEEFGEDISDNDSYWCVDPIDGTQNYAYGQPLYGSSVALIENGEPTVGVFYMPELSYLFYAVAGEGAYLNETELNVSSRTSFDNLYFTKTGWRDFSYKKLDTKWVQSFSCAVQSQAFVAAGWNDVVLCGPLNSWDFSAGVLLIREAGGVVKDIETERTDWGAIQDGNTVGGSETLVNHTLTLV